MANEHLFVPETITTEENNASQTHTEETQQTHIRRRNRRNEGNDEGPSQRERRRLCEKIMMASVGCATIGAILSMFLHHTFGAAAIPVATMIGGAVVMGLNYWQVRYSQRHSSPMSGMCDKYLDQE